MMVLSRFWILLLGLLLGPVAGPVASAAAGAAELTVYYPVAVSGQVAQAIQAMNRDFAAAHPDVQVKAVFTGDYVTTKQRVMEMAGRPDGPQMMVGLSADLFAFIDHDLIMAFSDVAGGREDYAWYNSFYPGFLKNSRWNRKVWSIPFQRSTIVLLYDKRAFAEAGLDPEHPPQTWAEMIEVAGRLTRRRPDGAVDRWGLTIPCDRDFAYWVFQALAAQNGVVLADEDGTATNFDAPGAVEALQLWLDLGRTHKVMPAGFTSWRDAPADFLAGRSAMIWTSSGQFANIREKADFPFGMAMLPKGRSRGTPTGGGNLYLLKGATPEQQQAAMAYARFISAPERTAAFSISTGYVVTRMDGWQAPAMTEFIRGFPSIVEARNQLAFAQAEFAVHRNDEVVAVLNSALADALEGRRRPAEALRDAQDKAAAILAPYRTR
ncbi:MAG TPA: ABC transporter substrate-binding protein [Azospirillaceae bacterium]|nr:ABC transporter substrate-binding protein [Azospirillaceae bacterium]